MPRIWPAVPLINYVASIGPADPQSWNRYSYAEGDPINYYDPYGLQIKYVGRSRCVVGAGEGAEVVDCDNYLQDSTLPMPVQTPKEAPHPILGPTESDESGVDVANRPLGFAGARASLAKEDCYKLFGFKTAGAAQRFFDGINFQTTHLGSLQVESVPEGTRVRAGTPPPAQTVGATVQVNYDYNWVDLSRVSASNVTTGTVQVFDYLGAINLSLGSNMDTSQLSNLILLHELKHVRGAPVESPDDFLKLNQDIYDKCIR